MVNPAASDGPLHHDTSPITQLPTEILLDVFFWASRRRGHVVDSVQEENRHTASIAQSLAFVCRRWLEVLAMNPLYWKDFEIIIDGPTFSLDIVATFLSMAAVLDDRMAVTVALSSADSRALTASRERERLSAIVQLLPPYFGRLSCLSINSVYRSSIVHASRSLDGAVLPQLERMVLVSQETDDTSSLQMSSFECPSITELEIDAKSFVDLSDCDISWPSVPEAFSLRITKYRPNTSFLALNAYSVIDALRVVNQATAMVLDIENVDVDPDDDLDDTLIYSRLESLIWLGLYGLDGTFISSLCSAIHSPGLDTVEVGRCEPSSRCRLPGAELRLNGIRSSCAILRLLQDWEGCTLVVKDCLGFDDWLLGALAYCDKTERVLACPFLSRIEIEGGCTAFSASALQRMCEMRPDAARIEDIEVNDAPALSGELGTWFRAHLDTFTWVERETETSHG